jgi:putative ABC transport system permease protein
MSHFWVLSLKNLRRNLKRNLATGSAIAFGFCGILLLQSYAYRVANFLRVNTVYGMHTGHLVIYAHDGFEHYPYQPRSFSLTPEDQSFIDASLKGDPDVELTEQQSSGQGLIGNGCISLPFLGQGYEPAVDRVLRNHPQMKEWVPDQKFIQEGSALAESGANATILLSVGLARALGKSLLPPGNGALPKTVMVDCASPNMKEQLKGDANVQLLSGTWHGNVSAVDGDIIGTYSTGFQEADNSAAITAVPLLQKLFDTDNVARVSVWLKDPSRKALVAARIREKASAAGKNYDVLSWDEERISPYYVGTTQFLSTIVGFVGMILAAIVALSVLNSTTMTILERSQEIGMYRSMGFRKFHVRYLYMQESCWLAIISLLAGGLMSGFIILIVNNAGITYYPPGMPGGLVLHLVPNVPLASITGAAILSLVMVTTYVAVSARLRFRPADLLGGTLR